jgi:hypothetical protein
VITEAGEKRLQAAIPPGQRILLDTSCLAAYLDRTEAVHAVARPSNLDCGPAGVVNAATRVVDGGWTAQHLADDRRHPR